MVLVGCDVSINSPGIVVTEGKMIDCFFFPHMKKHFGFQETIKNFNFSAIDYPVWNSREERYDKLSAAIIDKIDIYRKRVKTVKDISILIEGYAFMAKGRSVSAIYENGGVFRNQLFRRGYKTVTEIPPTELKKKFTGSGAANKLHMLMVFERKTGIDLFDIFGMKRPTGDQVRSPIQDIVDAYALIEIHSKVRKKMSIADAIIGSLNESHDHTRKNSRR